ncbi:MAG TPA: tRNA pseudouridine(55) synthase TruB [Firmicutes bacterium]|nr:tRNA pseudouridine(55) synthase TruB [Bacillota bacterium]
MKKIKSTSEYDGILIIDKISGMTSRDVVDKVSKILGTKKVGHTGTLDPLATGVLVLTIGKSNKLCNILISEYKEYEATFILGYETDTLDIEGKVLFESDASCSDEQIVDAISSFQKKYEQEVPLYSAVKVGGKRLYEYARCGIDVVLPKREVDIRKIEVISIDEEIKIRCCVSKGTYIRSLIRDIGRKLGTYATMSALRRTKQGNFSIEDAVSFECEDLPLKIRNIEEVLDDLEIVEVTGELEKKVSNGARLKSDYTHRFVMFVEKGSKIALYEKDGEVYKMFIKY